MPMLSTLRKLSTPSVAPPACPPRSMLALAMVCMQFGRWSMKWHPETGANMPLVSSNSAKKRDFQADPSRTSDVASILRGPGTHNRKFGKSVEVQCGPLVGPYPIEAFGTLLSETSTIGVAGKRPTLASSLAATFDGADRFAEPIADTCAQIGALRESGGRLSEPLWYACLGVVGYCRDGAQFGHEWSSGYDGYTYEETQARLERVKTLSGATTCVHFHSLNPKTCEACALWGGKINSPISLGGKQLMGEPDVQSVTGSANPAGGRAASSAQSGDAELDAEIRRL